MPHGLQAHHPVAPCSGPGRPGAPHECRARSGAAARRGGIGNRAFKGSNGPDMLKIGALGQLRQVESRTVPQLALESEGRRRWSGQQLGPTCMTRANTSGGSSSSLKKLRVSVSRLLPLRPPSYCCSLASEARLGFVGLRSGLILRPGRSLCWRTRWRPSCRRQKPAPMGACKLLRVYVLMLFKLCSDIL